MRNIDWMTVIVSIIMSSITVKVILIISIKKLQKNILEFQQDTVEACTDEVAKYINNKLNKIN